MELQYHNPWAAVIPSVREEMERNPPKFLPTHQPHH
jgi:hypothetical protein